MEQQVTTVSKPLPAANPQQMPTIPASLRQLVRNQTNPITGNEFWLPPKSVNIEERDAAVTFLRITRERLPAPSTEWLAAKIATLLAHYWMDGSFEQMKTLIAADWLAALQVFPQEQLDKAITQWRDTSKKRPTPADIRELAVEKMGRSAWETLMRVKKLTELPIVNRKTELPGAPKEHIKPTTEQKQRVASTMHQAGFHKEFNDGCPLCIAERQTGAKGA